MPGQDGTGPYGTYEGCVPVEYPVRGRGFGFGRGRGFGFGRTTMYNPRGLLRPRFSTGTRVDVQPVSQEEELDLLKKQKGLLSQNLDGIEKRIEELGK